MGFKINPLGKPFDVIDTSVTIPSFSSDPASGVDGQMIINTSSCVMKVYFGGSWIELHALVCVGGNYVFQDGNNYVFQDGNSYVYN